MLATPPNPASLMPVLDLLDESPFADGSISIPRSLEELEAQVRRELNITRYSSIRWPLERIGPDGRPALDALIVGGGQAGLAAGFGLKSHRIDRILIVDENPVGQEGPWSTYARMPTMRTHKEVGGIELGVPSLSFRAWHETLNGYGAFAELYKMPRDLWHAYLGWYKKVLALPVENSTELVAFAPAENGLLAATLRSGGIERVCYCRTLIFASGLEGNGGRVVPSFIDASVEKRFWAHTHERIDFQALAGKRVLTLGGGASAFDAAIFAAEAGAEVHVFHRQQVLNPLNVGTWAEFNGYLAHFSDLPDAYKWTFLRQLGAKRTGPPKRTFAKAMALPNLHIHPGEEWRFVGRRGERLTVEATSGTQEADYLILGTGYRTDLNLVSEFAPHLDKIALWKDRFAPPQRDAGDTLLNAPYLGPNFEFLEKTPGEAPWLGAVFDFARGANVSMGTMPIGLSGIKFGVPRLIAGVGKRLFSEDADLYLAGLRHWQSHDMHTGDT